MTIQTTSETKPVFKNLAEFFQNVLRVMTQLQEKGTQTFCIESWKQEENDEENNHVCGTTFCVLGSCVEDAWFKENVFEEPYWRCTRRTGTYTNYVPIFKKELIAEIEKHFNSSPMDGYGVFDMLHLYFTYLVAKDSNRSIEEETIDLLNEICFTGVGRKVPAIDGSLLNGEHYQEYLIRVSKVVKATEDADSIETLTSNINNAAESCFHFKPALNVD